MATENAYSTNNWKNPLKPALYAMNLMGRIPFTVNKSGDLTFKKFSFPMIWAILGNSYLTVKALILFRWRITHSEYWASFDKSLNSLNLLVFFTCVFQGVLFSWMDTPGIVAAYNRFNTFQVNIQTVLKKRLSSVMIKYSYLGLLLVIFIISELVIDTTTQPLTLVNISTSMLFTACCVYGSTVVLLWSILCFSVKSTAELLKDSIIEDLDSLPSLEVFGTYRLLLAEFQECTTQMTNALAKILHSAVISFILLLLLSIYVLLMFLLVDHTLDIGHSVEAIIFRSFCLWMVFSMGHFAQKSMKDDLLAAIYSRGWLQLDGSSRTELDFLLDMIEMRKPCFEIDGLFVIDRLELLPIVQTIFTYLVVMMQFKGLANNDIHREN